MSGPVDVVPTVVASAVSAWEEVRDDHQPDGLPGWSPEHRAWTAIGDAVRCYAAAVVAESQAADAALLAMARCIPPRSLAEMARVFTYGGEKHGAAANASGGGQTALDHIAHALGHMHEAERAESYEQDPYHHHAAPSKDTDTGALHSIHAACRAALAAELVMAGEEGK